MSKFSKIIGLTALMLASAGAYAQDPIAELLDTLSEYEYGDVRMPLRQAHLWVTNALDSEADSAAVAAALATVLERDATLDGKQFVCRQLARIGGPAEVPILAELLNNEETADMARYALQPIPGPEADAALIAALDTTSGDVRVGVINTLGERRANDAVAPLRKLAKHGDAMEAEAAVAALGKIGTGRARRALRWAKHGASPELRASIEDAVMVCREMREADQT